MAATLAIAAEEASVAEARKREFASLQNELKELQSAVTPSLESAKAYAEKAKAKYETFSKANPKTTEGFEAAFLLARLANQTMHKDALKYAELAVDTAPATGADVSKLAKSWYLVVKGRLSNSDKQGAKLALEKDKEPNPQMYVELLESYKPIGPVKRE